MNTTTVKKPCNHVLHLILTLATFGLWSPVWILCAITGRKETTVHYGGYGQPPAQPGQYVWNPYAGRWQ